MPRQETYARLDSGPESANDSSGDQTAWAGTCSDHPLSQASNRSSVALHHAVDLAGSHNSYLESS